MTYSIIYCLTEDKTDWDKMIADLNQISESCGLRERPHTPPTHLTNTHTGEFLSWKPN